MADYKWKIEELKKEVKELEEEKELTMNQSRIDFIDEQIVNTKDSIKKLEAYA
jgi:pimeloyl-CoA synthetase